MPDGDTGVSRRTLAEKLTELYTTAIPPSRNGKPWSDRAVAAAINESAGEKVISAAWVGMLRAGTKDNPTKQHIEELEALFGVERGYLLDERQTPSPDVDPVRVLAIKGRSLSEAGLKQIADMIDYVVELERAAGKGTPERPPR